MPRVCNISRQVRQQWEANVDRFGGETISGDSLQISPGAVTLRDLPGNGTISLLFRPLKVLTLTRAIRLIPVLAPATLDADLDEDEDADADVATNTEFDEDATLDSGGASDEQVSEAEADFYQQFIAQCEAGGPTIANHGENTNKMTTSEIQKWNM
ncbi:hypothetical protein DL768_007298 [Monosporascus sp. mg162]|nr:hypothetical protein DL768_007298 [Monosporascus sp. mg162]